MLKDVLMAQRKYYRSQLKKFASGPGFRFAFFLEQHGMTISEESWLPWFRETHPELAVKYDNAIEKINTLWDNNTPQAMEEFKAAVKIEIDAMTWAVQKWMEHHKEKIKEESLRGTQTEMAIR